MNLFSQKREKKGTDLVVGGMLYLVALALLGGGTIRAMEDINYFYSLDYQLNMIFGLGFFIPSIYLILFNRGEILQQPLENHRLDGGKE